MLKKFLCSGRVPGFTDTRIYLAVYCPEIIGGFDLEEKGQKTKAVCGLGRTNYGGLRNVQPPNRIRI